MKMGGWPCGVLARPSKRLAARIIRVSTYCIVSRLPAKPPSSRGLASVPAAVPAFDAAAAVVRCSFLSASGKLYLADHFL